MRRPVQIAALILRIPQKIRVLRRSVVEVFLPRRTGAIAFRLAVASDVTGMAVFRDPLRGALAAEADTLRDGDLRWVLEATRLQALERAGIVQMENNIDWTWPPLAAQIEKMTGLLYPLVMKTRGNSP